MTQSSGLIQDTILDRSSINTTESWELATSLAHKYSDVPSFFSACTRLMLRDQEQNNAQLRPASKYLVSQFFRGKNFKAMLYYTGQDLSSEDFSQAERLTVGNLLDLFQPIDLAVLVSVYLLYQRTRKGEDTVERANLKRFFKRDSRLGGFAGAAIPTIGIAKGVLAGSMYYISLLTFLKKDPAKVKEFLSSAVKDGELSVDPILETEHFGCSTLQLATVYLTRLGFGRKFAEAYSGALDPETHFQDLQGDVLYSIRFGQLWIECLRGDAEQPVEKMPGEYYPIAEQRERLEAQARGTDGNTACWFDRGKDDLSPEQTPALFCNSQESDVPEQLSEIFSMDEITEMEEEDFDELIDHIDPDSEPDTAPLEEDEESPEEHAPH